MVNLIDEYGFSQSSTDNFQNNAATFLTLPELWDFKKTVEKFFADMQTQARHSPPSLLMIFWKLLNVKPAESGFRLKAIHTKKPVKVHRKWKKCFKCIFIVDFASF